jgi:hypothetical protein
MSMLLTMGQLRRLLMREMKLGIAGGQDDARAWGKKPLPDEPIYSPPEGGETYLATDNISYDPGEEIRALYRGRHSRDMADDPIGAPGADIDDKPVEPGKPRIRR